MSEPGTDIEDAATASLDLNDGVNFDQDLAFGAEGEDDNIERSYVPDDRPRGAAKHGMTVTEQSEGGVLEERLAAEEPEVDATPSDADQLATDILGEDPRLAENPAAVGDLRAGRLVAPDEGVRADSEKDMVAQDVGIDAGAASGEEAAMHILQEPGR